MLAARWALSTPHVLCGCLPEEDYLIFFALQTGAGARTLTETGLLPHTCRMCRALRCLADCVLHAL